MSPFTVLLGVRRSMFGAVLVAACSVLVACSTTDEPKKPAPLPPNIEQPGRHLISVTERQAGANIVLDAAQELAVRLPLDEMEVRTGLDWLLIEVKPTVLANGASRFEVAQRNANADGVSGEVVWRFNPQSAGSTPLRFELRYPHNRDPATRVATYLVRVK